MSLEAHLAKTYPPMGGSDGTLSLDEFKKLHAKSIADPSAYWSKEARERLHWFVPFSQGLQGDFHAGDVTWFAGGQLNAW